MADMIKFFKGLEASLPASGVNGALYITTDEGAIYLGTGNGMKRLGDFVQVDNVASLPEKAHESCLYYCVAENILAKWNGTEWKQINKQPTAEELKTLLGLGSLAYLSEVSEANLDASLKEKVNAAAEGNHSHANKALLDTYTQTEADLADAVAKKHAHANAEELAKIADGDKAKWDAVVADHLTSADKTTLENSIKDAKKAGTDANTNIETYKVSNDARVKAVEDDIAEITASEGGILAQAKAYADGKDGAIAEAKKAGTDANAALEAYKTSNDTALAGVKATADAAAVKTEVESALAGKVDKVEGKSLISDAEITRLAGVTNYDDTQVKADIAKKADSATMTTELGKKVDKVEGYSLVSDTEIARLAEVDNYDDEEVRGLIGDNADAIAEIAGDYVKGADIADFETKENVKKVSDDLAAYIESNDAAVADRYTKVEADGKFALIADAYDDEEVRGLISANVQAIADEESRAKGVEEGLQNQINLIMNNPDTKDVIDSIAEFTQYVADHGTIAEGMRTDINKNAEDIAANAKAIADQATADEAKYETKDDASAKLAEAKEYADDINTALDARLDVLEAIDHDAYVDADATLKSELQAEIDADVKVVNDAFEAYKTSNNAEVAKKANSADVYAKTETYNQSEIEALLTWGEF